MSVRRSFRLPFWTEKEQHAILLIPLISPVPFPLSGTVSLCRICFEGPSALLRKREWQTLIYTLKETGVESPIRVCHSYINRPVIDKTPDIIQNVQLFDQLSCITVKYCKISMQRARLLKSRLMLDLLIMV